MNHAIAAKERRVQPLTLAEAVLVAEEKLAVQETAAAAPVQVALSDSTPTEPAAALAFAAVRARMSF